MEPSVLLVLDEERIDYFDSFFKKNYPKFNVFITNSIRDAVSIISTNRIVISILDLVINNTNGFEIAELLKTKDKNCQVLFIASPDLSSVNIANYDMVDGFIHIPLCENLIIKQLNFHLLYYKKTEDLLYSQEVFKKISDEIDNIVFILDENLNIIYYNHGFLNSFGPISSLDKLRKFFPSIIIDFVKEKIEEMQEVCKNNSLEFIFKDEHYKVSVFNYFCENKNFLVLINIFKPEISLNSYFLPYSNDIYKQYLLYKKISSEKLPSFRDFSFYIVDIFSEGDLSTGIYKFHKTKDKFYFIFAKTLNSGLFSYYSSIILKEFFNRNLEKLTQNLVDFMSSFQDFYYENKFKDIINIFAGFIDVKRKEIKFCLCGFNQPRVINEKGIINNLFVKDWNFPIGIAKNYSAYRFSDFDFSNFNKLAVFSDEIVEFDHKDGKDTDYFIIDKFLKNNVNESLEDLKMIKMGEGFIKNSSTFIIFNFIKPIKEKIFINKSSSVDDITNRIIEIVNNFDISFGFKKRCFIVLEEIISNMIKYGDGGKLSYKVDHEKVIFLFENITDKPFNPWEYIEALDKEDENLTRENILKNVKSDSVKLGLYMSEKSSDRFWASSDGKYICVCLKNEARFPFILD